MSVFSVYVPGGMAMLAILEDFLEGLSLFPFDAVFTDLSLLVTFASMLSLMGLCPNTLLNVTLNSFMLFCLKYLQN